MDKPALRNALSSAVAGLTDALAALGDDDDTPAVIEVVPEHDYHAEELERIEAQTAAAVAVIEAEADATVKVLDASAANAPDPTSPEPIETLDTELVDEPIEDNPIMDESIAPLDEPGDLADADEAVQEATDVLDALPVIEPEAVADVAPVPQHWYTKKLFGKR